MKLDARGIERLLQRPDLAHQAVLIYGPNEGLVQERRATLAAKCVPDLSDSFAVAQLTPENLRQDPARLGDEARALAMTGGPRLVFIDGATDSLAAVFETFLGNYSGENHVIATAGALGPRAALRRTFEQAETALAVPCYEDTPREIGEMVQETFRDSGFTVAGDGQAYLLSHLGGDRQIIRRELEKLLLYLGTPESTSGAPSTVSLEQVSACIGDSATLTVAAVAAAATGGRLGELETSLAKCRRLGENPIPILRALTQRLLRLHQTLGLMEGGLSIERATGALRPPLFFRDAAAFKQDCGRWSSAHLARALKIVTEAELQCKTTGMPAETLCARACLQIAHAAAQKTRVPSAPARRGAQRSRVDTPSGP